MVIEGYCDSVGEPFASTILYHICSNLQKKRKRGERKFLVVTKLLSDALDAHEMDSARSTQVRMKK